MLLSRLNGLATMAILCGVVNITSKEVYDRFIKIIKKLDAIILK